MALRRTAIGARAITRFLVLCLLALPEACIPTADDRVRYICFGDSATYGTTGRESSYPEELGKLLTEAGLCTVPECVANQGVWGEAACGGLGRLTGTGSILDPAIYPNAEAILYLEGGNDMLDQGWNPQIDRPISGDEIAWIHGGLKDCIHQAMKLVGTNRPNLQRYLGTYYSAVPGKPYPNFPQGLTEAQAAIVNQYVAELNLAVRSLGGEMQIPVVSIDDLGAVCGGPPYDCYVDAMHLNADGFPLMAGVWYEAILGAVPYR